MPIKRRQRVPLFLIMQSNMISPFVPIAKKLKHLDQGQIPADAKGEC
jgi:hypothetical protein